MAERLTNWFPADVKPSLPGWYEREYISSWMGKLHDKWDGECWLVGDGNGNAIVQAGKNRRWRGLAEDPNRTTHEAEALGDKALKRCAAGRDGECGHAQCPQLRDGEPAKSGRHCPLDNEGSDEQ